MDASRYLPNEDGGHPFRTQFLVDAEEVDLHHTLYPENRYYCVFDVVEEKRRWIYSLFINIKRGWYGGYESD